MPRNNEPRTSVQAMNDLFVKNIIKKKTVGKKKKKAEKPMPNTPLLVNDNSLNNDCKYKLPKLPEPDNRLLNETNSFRVNKNLDTTFDKLFHSESLKNITDPLSQPVDVSLLIVTEKKPIRPEYSSLNMTTTDSSSFFNDHQYTSQLKLVSSTPKVIRLESQIINTTCSPIKGKVTAIEEETYKTLNDWNIHPKGFVSHENSKQQLFIKKANLRRSPRFLNPSPVKEIVSTNASNDAFENFFTSTFDPSTILISKDCSSDESNNSSEFVNKQRRSHSFSGFENKSENESLRSSNNNIKKIDVASISKKKTGKNFKSSKMFKSVPKVSKLVNDPNIPKLSSFENSMLSKYTNMKEFRINLQRCPSPSQLQMVSNNEHSDESFLLRRSTRIKKSVTTYKEFLSLTDLNDEIISEQSENALKRKRTKSISKNENDLSNNNKKQHFADNSMFNIENTFNGLSNDLQEIREGNKQSASTFNDNNLLNGHKKRRSRSTSGRNIFDSSLNDQNKGTKRLTRSTSRRKTENTFVSSLNDQNKVTKRITRSTSRRKTENTFDISQNNQNKGTKRITRSTSRRKTENTFVSSLNDQNKVTKRITRSTSRRKTENTFDSSQNDQNKGTKRITRSTSTQKTENTFDSLLDDQNIITTRRTQSTSRYKNESTFDKSLSDHYKSNNRSSRSISKNKSENSSDNSLNDPNKSTTRSSPSTSRYKNGYNFDKSLSDYNKCTTRSTRSALRHKNESTYDNSLSDYNKSSTRSTRSASRYKAGNSFDNSLNNHKLNTTRRTQSIMINKTENTFDNSLNSQKYCTKRIARSTSRRKTESTLDNSSSDQNIITTRRTRSSSRRKNEETFDNSRNDQNIITIRRTQSTSRCKAETMFDNSLSDTDKLNVERTQSMSKIKDKSMFDTSLTNQKRIIIKGRSSTVNTSMLETAQINNSEIGDNIYRVNVFMSNKKVTKRKKNRELKENFNFKIDTSDDENPEINGKQPSRSSSTTVSSVSLNLQIEDSTDNESDNIDSKFVIYSKNGENSFGSVSTSNCQETETMECIDIEDSDDEDEDKNEILLEDNQITVKPGKSWRRSLTMIKKNSIVLRHKSYYNQNAQRNQFRNSVMIPLTSFEDDSFSKFQMYLRRKSKIEGYAKKPNGFDIVINESPPTAEEIVLQYCHQNSPLNFSKCFPDSSLQNCHKIGEGVYGEVFMYRNSRQEPAVLKIIPIEGDMLVNGEKQKKYDEIVSEIIIASELSGLRLNDEYSTDGFNKINCVRCIKGKYPDRLLDLWDLFEEDRGSENDSPRMFDDDQLFIILELANGGRDLEAFMFKNSQQAHSIFLQIASSLAVAESVLYFEHRDLHWGNVLISKVDDVANHTFKFDGTEYDIPTFGVKASIIDFTLSRIIYDNTCIFYDLRQDPDLFTSVGDYQFEIYRLMRKNNKNDWQKFEPRTNIFWLHYILRKMIKDLRYKNISSRKHAEYIQILEKYEEDILTYKSTKEFIIKIFC